MRAVLDKLDATPSATADELFKLVGMTLVSSVGGASGPLYGTFFLRLGAACGPVAELSPDDLAKALRAGVEGLVARGKPELGDKTMFDAPAPGPRGARRGARPAEARPAKRSPPPRGVPRRAATPPSRWWPARAGPATSASAAPATRIPAPRRRRCCSKPPPATFDDLGSSMVGIVVVSHSRRLAEAAVELALQMVRGTPPPIEIAAGLDGDVLGTDAAECRKPSTASPRPTGCSC